MLPKGFNLDGIDEGIRDLVVTLNKIPEVNQRTTPYGPTTCEGHAENSYLLDGWFYFYKDELKRAELIAEMNQFCKERSYFDLDSQSMQPRDFAQLGFDLIPPGNFLYYDLSAHFECDGSTWGMNEAEKQSLIERTRIRKQGILEGWAELNTRVKDYITTKITKDLSSLPFMTEEDWQYPIPSCPHHACH
jgi:hypothetical protein